MIRRTRALFFALVLAPTGPAVAASHYSRPLVIPPRRSPKGSSPGASFHLRSLALTRLLQREAGYIDNCSFTEYARNHRQVRWAADAYGALNMNRMAERGPDWVRPGDAAMGVIGLTVAARQLRAAGADITRHDRVLRRFFQNWLLGRRPPVDRDAADADAGGFYERVYYDPSGAWQRCDPPNAGVTGQVIAAMWKYYEYNHAIGQRKRAWRWLKQAWPLARAAGDFLHRSYDPTYRLVRSNSRSADLWITDSVYAAMALRCLDHWARTIRSRRPENDAALARKITQGIRRLRDNKRPWGFFRYRDARRGFQPTYGDRIDQLCFLPYEADLLSLGEKHARRISDGWTHGSGRIRMTFPTMDANDWRCFGTHWWYLFPGVKERETNRYLYPGPGLQLAKIEWKRFRITGDRVTLERARRRFEWACSPGYSNLWLGASGVVEAGVGGGLVDWRDAAQYQHKADDWARFVDTSAYFIEVALMLGKGIDTRYIPYEAAGRKGASDAKDHRRRDPVFR